MYSPQYIIDLELYYTDTNLYTFWNRK